MNEIKLPVISALEPYSLGLFKIVDSSGNVVVRDLAESIANQIAHALNLHNELVVELDRVVDCGAGYDDRRRIAKLLERLKP